MLSECASSCGACDRAARCAWDANDTALGVPARSHAQFPERATTLATGLETGQAEVLSTDPLVLQVDGFLSSAEASQLAELASGLGFVPSEVLGKQMGAGSAESATDWRRSSHRTSSSVFCDEQCYAQPAVASMLERASRLTLLGLEHTELQFLHYETGQYYKSHHDYLGGSEKFMAGPRVLSGLLYLNDVEEGGETSFPVLELTVSPRAGRLLLWADVLDDQPMVKDVRTRHAALPVTRGQKFAANLWYYHRSVSRARRLGCMG
jgi:prolyl 4-hydroxylase